jgi:hypothetical protein
LAYAAGNQQEAAVRAFATILAYLILGAVPLVWSVEPAMLASADMRAWLDGFMPNASYQGDIAGAVVVVVKNEAPLTEAARAGPFSFGEASPFEVFERTVWWKSSSWVVPLVIVASVALLLNTLAKPVGARGSVSSTTNSMERGLLANMEMVPGCARPRSAARERATR